MSDLLLPPAERDPLATLSRVRGECCPGEDLWVFGYASLIWRPEFEAEEERAATVFGWHRALEMRSRINRGTPQKPGLVFALVPGGSCRGIAYRIAAARVDEELPRLWQREMPTGVYDPRWLPCRTPGGAVRALGFTLNRGSPQYVGPLPDAQMVDILGSACGRFGSTLDYLLQTAASLRGCGIRDREIERLVGLAQRHALA